MSFDDDFDGPEPYEDDLQTFSDNQAWEDAQADMLMSWTAQFEDGCQVDLKVVNAADGPYLDVVLFDQDGCEIGLEEGDAPILGEHAFSGYTLTVEGEAE